jgi:phosphatidylglycerophosphatase A
MSNNNNHPLGEAPWFHVIFSTGLGTGFCPGAPGTAGAFLALLTWFGLTFVLSAAAMFWVTLALVVVTTVAGAWTSNVMERYWGEDPRTVVIDEFVGTWMACLGAAVPVAASGCLSEAAASGCGLSEAFGLFSNAPCDPLLSGILGLFGFAMFRIIDIVKTPLARKLEHVPNGWGVMLDDVLAGFYALILTLILRAFLA